MWVECIKLFPVVHSWKLFCAATFCFVLSQFFLPTVFPQPRRAPRCSRQVLLFPVTLLRTSEIDIFSFVFLVQIQRQTALLDCTNVSKYSTDEEDWLEKLDIFRQAVLFASLKRLGIFWEDWRKYTVPNIGLFRREKRNMQVLTELSFLGGKHFLCSNALIRHKEIPELVNQSLSSILEVFKRYY